MGYYVTSSRSNFIVAKMFAFEYTHTHTHTHTHQTQAPIIMPHTHDDSDLQADEEVRCIGCCTGCALPGHRCCDVQAGLDGLHEAVYEERGRLGLLDASTKSTHTPGLVCCSSAGG